MPVDDCPVPDAADAVVRLRTLAREGRLAETARAAAPAERLRLTGAAYSIAYPVVFHRLTRGMEQRRGHWACASAVTRLADTCLDRFYDDTEAVVEDVLTRATSPINNLEGWIVTRLGPATVDAHRRRRGARGALQRPRLPAWLAHRLLDDPWLGQLAIEILIWVGVPVTSGTSLWPLDSWAERRATATGDWTGSDARTVERDVERVLAAMRDRPQWYAEHVERPLGAKTAPVASASPEPGGPQAEAGLVALVGPHEVDDARLTELAAAALGAIEARLAAGEDRTAVVADVIRQAFGALDAPGELAGLPFAAPGADEQVVALLADPAEVARIVEVVQLILAPSGRT